MKKTVISILLVASFAFLAGCKQTTPTPPVAIDNGTDTPSTDNQPNGVVDENSLGACLAQAGVKMYGTEWCSHCQNQKGLFGDDFANVDYTDCDQQRPACIAAGVQGYPTWIDTAGNKYPGVQSLEKLAGIAGCEI